MSDKKLVMILLGFLFLAVTVTSSLWFFESTIGVQCSTHILHEIGKPASLKTFVDIPFQHE